MRDERLAIGPPADEAVAAEWPDRYDEAAVLGEYLMTRYPETDSARQGAKIALAAWVRLYGEAKPDDREFEIA